MKVSKISVVIPVYNSEKTIVPLVEKLISLTNVQMQEVQEIQEIQEVVLVHDGGNDRSPILCEQLHYRFPDKITFVDLSKNFGEHSAVMAGLHYATGDFVVIIDDDFQNPPEVVFDLVSCANELDFDVVYGVYDQKRHSWWRNLGSRFNGMVASWVLNKPSNLYLSSCKCLNRFIIDEIKKYRLASPYIDALILRSTSRVGQRIIAHCHREQGKSNYTFKRLLALWSDMFFGQSTKPLRCVTLLGLLLVFVALIIVLSVGVGIVGIVFLHFDLFNLYNLYNLYNSVNFSVFFNVGMLIFILVLALIVLLVLYLFTEYFGRLYQFANETPQFVVRRVFSREVKK